MVIKYVFSALVVVLLILAVFLLVNPGSGHVRDATIVTIPREVERGIHEAGWEQKDGFMYIILAYNLQVDSNLPFMTGPLHGYVRRISHAVSDIAPISAQFPKGVKRFSSSPSVSAWFIIEVAEETTQQQIETILSELDFGVRPETVRYWFFGSGPGKMFRFQVDNSGDYSIRGD